MKNIAFALACVSVSILACSKSPSAVDSTEASSLGDVHVIYTPPVSEAKAPSPCPDDMVLVSGMYCPKVEEKCLYYVDIHGNKMPPGPMPQQTGRCGQFEYPTKCLSDKRVYKRFCIDKFEIPNVEGQRPTSWLTYTDVENFCKSKNKRIATSSEWEFSCEGTGENPRPYPYGNGYTRDHTACNTDNPLPKGMDVFKATSHNTETAKKLDAMLVPSGSMSTCVSSTGVSDQVGNEDEYVKNETGEGYISGLKGGHIWGVRGRCRPMTTAHNGVAPPKGAGFAWYETSGRCAKDADF